MQTQQRPQDMFAFVISYKYIFLSAICITDANGINNNVIDWFIPKIDTITSDMTQS